MYVQFFFFFVFFLVWNYYFISARWLPPLRINKVKVKVKVSVSDRATLILRMKAGLINAVVSIP